MSLVQKANSSITLIDNYVDVNTLNILCKKNDGVTVGIITAGKGRLSEKDISKFNSQYPKLTVKKSDSHHDRYLIIDEKELYHIGASIKDAGKKSFGINKIEDMVILKHIINK